MKSNTKKFIVIALLLFVGVSSLFISSARKETRSQIRSAELKKQTITKGNIERTDFVDNIGKTTIAADLGYATVIVTKTENSTLEQYYDEKGDPISRSNGYYAMLREYDERGNNTRIIYMNRNCEPMIMANGYAIEEREYNEKRQIIAERYYDVDGNPILTPLYGYGERYDYNQNGKVYKITYINDSGVPMITKQGYASVIREYYPLDGPRGNLVEKEMYFDEQGTPICLTLGQFGVHKEYDKYGRISVLTYLDIVGKTVSSSKGYATIKWTYHPDNTIETERYFDLEGKPFALSEGQYGIKRERGKTIYLNKEGNEILNLRTILYNHSWIVIVIATAVILFSAMVGKKMNIVLFFLCICVIIYLTLMFRDGNETNKTSFLWYYRKIFTSREARADIIKNIWLFIPLGTILYHLYPKKIILLVPVLLSLAIEGTQYFTGTGYCELDDVISNSIGGWIGFYSGKVTTALFLRINNWKQKHSV